MSTTVNRLRELDFLRGVAILLVLLRHHYLFQFTLTMGWIGVDLFFVLSGFLVSGLLYKEYMRFGDIRPGNFLIRRGFKIYPIYYLTYIIYLLPFLLKGTVVWSLVFADLVFVQNYVNGVGYTYNASWSLAVEEHFYFGLSLFLWLALRRGWVQLRPSDQKTWATKPETIIVSVMVLCLGLRIGSNLYMPEEFIRNFTMTHLRIDALLAGVLISYWYYFRREQMQAFFARHRVWLLGGAALLLSWTPFIDPVHSFFVKTVGFLMLTLAFGVLLVAFLLTENINTILNRLFTRPLVTLTSRIGFCSYSIYVIHSIVNHYVKLPNHYLGFVATSAISVSVGMVMTYFLETFFLRIRDKYYPSRTQ